MKTETAVKQRYQEGAKQRVEDLCCPVDYDPQYLKVIPEEVIQRDYGCGDPSKYLNPGETVLDLGSGTGKICFIASQVVGKEGRVIGVDMTDEMLEVARRYAPVVAERIGHANVTFKKGRIQDLALDLDVWERELKNHAITDANSYLAAQERVAELRLQQPMIPNDSVDVVVSNCVLNLVSNEQRQRLFKEIYRVLRKGGRAVISDIVSDEDVPLEMQNDPELWSGCVSGAYREDLFLRAFEEAGFYGVQILSYQSEPWQTVQGIEFRSVTVEATKGKEGPCLERNQAVIYKGPFKQVTDDDGHVMERGKRYALCDKTYNLFQKPPYAGCFIPVDPHEEIPLEEAADFDCARPFPLRHPRESKGQDYDVTTEASSCCC